MAETRDEECEVGNVVSAYCFLIAENISVLVYHSVKWRQSFGSALDRCMFISN